MELGGSDFVATMIALNLAVEFWTPLRDFVGQILETTEKRAVGIRGCVEASQIDEPAKNVLSAEAERRLQILKTCAARHKGRAHLVSRWASILASIAGLCLLFLGVKSIWNLFLLLPLAVFLTWSVGLYLVLFWKVKAIRSTLGSDLCAHVFDGKSLAIPAPDASTDEEDSSW